MSETKHTPGPSNEQRYYDALKRITEYQTPARMRRSSEKDWGLPFEEHLEYAYENIQQEAKTAILGRRRPAGKQPKKRAGERPQATEAQNAGGVANATEEGEGTL
jgi:hypothetical protein